MLLVALREQIEHSSEARDKRPKAALDALDAGMSKTQICNILGVSRQTLDTWQRRTSRTGA